NGSSMVAAMSNTDTGGAANAYVVSPTNPPSGGLGSNITGYFIPAHANTGASTLNWAGLGNKAITKCGTTALASGDMLTTVQAEVIYDGTEFQLLNPQAVPCVTGLPSGVTATNMSLTTPSVTPQNIDCHAACAPTA